MKSYVMLPDSTSTRWEKVKNTAPKDLDTEIEYDARVLGYLSLEQSCFPYDGYFKETTFRTIGFCHPTSVIR